ncbi:hypothetical protein [Bacillus phage BM-P1]|nr:hypothetical protein [Bacillus phage BM-P1]
MSSFTLLTVSDIISLYSSCLREGIASQQEGNYRTKDGSIALIVSPSAHYIEAYSKHTMVLRMDFRADNKTWYKATKGDREVYPLSDLAAAVSLTSQYDNIKIEKGLFYGFQ